MDLLGQPFGDLLAVVEHGDVLGDAHDDAHVVLDEQNGDAQLIAQPANELGRLRGLARVHARGRLVEQEQLGFTGQRAGNLQPALIAVGQVARQCIALAAQAHEVQQIPGIALRLLLLPPGAGRADDGAHPRGLQVGFAADHDVLDGRHIAEEADILEGARDAALGNLEGLQSVEGLAVEVDFPFVDLVETGDAVEKGGLARAVGADNAHDAVARDHEVDRVDGDETTETLGDIGCHKNVVSHAHFLCARAANPERRRTRRVNPPADARSVRAHGFRFGV